mgnify:CR=1 FL=1
MSPNLRHVYVCRVVAQLGSISAAARHVHLSQPAVTQAVASVEAFFAERLFVRRSAGVTLTPAGEIVLARIARAITQLQEALADLLRRRGQPIDDMQRLVWRVTSAQLAALAAFAEHKDFTNAARASGIAPPTLHRAARTLERTLEVPLFEKTSFGVRPTRDAEAFARRVRLVFAELNQARADVDALRGGTSGTTVIGAMPLARSFIVPSALIAFVRSHPDHSVSIMEGPYEHLFAALQAGEADFLIGALRPAATDVQQEHLFDDPLSIVVRAGHPLASRKQLRPADLARYPWIAPRRTSPLRTQFDALFKAAGLAPPAQPVQCNSLIAARALLLEGDFLMLSSVHQIHYELRAGMLVALPHPQGRVVRAIGLTMRRNWQPTRAQVRLLDLIRERAQRYAVQK